MKQKRILLSMVLVSLAGLVVCGIILLFANPARLQPDLLGYGLGAICALLGYGMIVIQYSQKASYWMMLAVPGFFLRMVIYGAGIWLCLSLDASILFFVLGLTLCLGTLVLDTLRR